MILFTAWPFQQMMPQAGREITVTYMRGNRQETLLVKIPPGVREGTNLRLRGMGLDDPTGGRPGDLFLQISIR